MFRLLAAVTTALVLAAAAPAAAQRAGGNTSPSYPGNTIALSQKVPLVAGTIVTTRLSGRANWGEPTGPATIGYTLHLFPQDASLSPSCAASMNEQRTKYINLTQIKAAAGFSGFVLDGQLAVSPRPPAPTIDWAIESPPYAIREGVRKILLCGYVTDHVAAYQLPVTVTPQACRLSSSRPKKGSRLGLKCNVSGPATITLRRGRRTRKVTTTISTKDGRARIRTGRLARGSYKMAVRIRGDQIGRTLSLRVR